MKSIYFFIIGIIIVISTFTAIAQGQGGKRGGGNKRPVDTVLPAVITAQQNLSIVLGRPTTTSVTANILSAVSAEGYIEYGVATGNYTKQSRQYSFIAGMPAEILIDSLDADTQYYYRLRIRRTGENIFSAGNEYTFHTQRAPGSAFTFAIQGDSHPERPQQHAPSLYAQTLKAVAAEHPDFYLTIGDDFSVDTLREINAATVKDVYLRQRYCLSLAGQTVPIFLVNGNHEQAALYNLNGTADNVAVWAQNNRNLYFSQPAPDKFYTGDALPVANIGLLRDYYAWRWGDAHFIVIDPYWHSTKPVDNVFGGGEKRRDLWEVTIGDVQYKWLKETLEKSTAKYKFIFTHHVLGTGRGGIEQATLFEWGGKDKKGKDQFAEKRPQWAMPIHQLFVKNGVNIVFQGHDHIFVRQELDGITYQTLPDPANPNYLFNNADAYLTGDKYPGSGYVRVNVSPDKVDVSYIRQYLPADENDKRKSGETAFSYSVGIKK